jgi:hypothetical protein
MDSTFPVLVLEAVGQTTLGGPGGGDGVFGVGLAAQTPAHAVGTVDFDHLDALAMEVSGQPSAIRTGALHADQDDRSEALHPRKELLVARCRRLEGLDAEQGALLVEGGRHVDVEVRIEATSHRSCQSVHCHPFSWWGWHRTDRTTDKTAMSLVWASSYEVTPSNRPVSSG